MFYLFEENRHFNEFYRVGVMKKSGARLWGTGTTGGVYGPVLVALPSD